MERREPFPDLEHNHLLSATITLLGFGLDLVFDDTVLTATPALITVDGNSPSGGAIFGTTVHFDFADIINPGNPFVLNPADPTFLNGLPLGEPLAGTLPFGAAMEAAPMVAETVEPLAEVIEPAKFERRTVKRDSAGRRRRRPDP